MLSAERPQMRLPFHVSHQNTALFKIGPIICVRTRKLALEYTVFTGKRVVENARQTLQFYLGASDVYTYQITPFLPCGLCFSYRAAFYSILRYEKNVTWIYSASHFASVEDAQGFIVGFSFVFSPANGKSQGPIRAKKDIYCLDTAESIGRVCSLRGMSKEES